MRTSALPSRSLKFGNANSHIPHNPACQPVPYQPLSSFTVWIHVKEYHQSFKGRAVRMVLVRLSGVALGTRTSVEPISRHSIALPQHLKLAVQILSSRTDPNIPHNLSNHFYGPPRQLCQNSVFQLVTVNFVWRCFAASFGGFKRDFPRILSTIWMRDVRCVPDKSVGQRRAIQVRLRFKVLYTVWRET